MIGMRRNRRGKMVSIEDLDQGKVRSVCAVAGSGFNELVIHNESRLRAPVGAFVTNPYGRVRALLLMN